MSSFVLCSASGSSGSSIITKVFMKQAQKSCRRVQKDVFRSVSSVVLMEQPKQQQQQQQQQSQTYSPTQEETHGRIVQQRLFSSASSPRRRTLETKDPIIVTDRAADRIKELLAGDNAGGALGIRLGVKRRGCNGLSYTLNYVFDEQEKDNTNGKKKKLTEKDIEMTSPHGIRLFIEPMALFNVVGTTMDWEENELSSEFTFNNPNSKGECGCGESFNV